MYGTILRRDRNEFVSDAFPHKVEVKFTVVRQQHLLRLDLIDEYFTEVKLRWLRGRSFNRRFISHYRVVNLVTFSFYIQDQGTSLSLNIALEVVVVVDLVLGVELNFNLLLAECWHKTTHRSHFE